MREPVFVRYGAVTSITTGMAQPAKLITPTEVVAGWVDRVTFHNPENGFCMLRVKARAAGRAAGCHTRVGHSAMVSAGVFPR